MKIKKILFLSLFLIIGLLLFMPNSVNAAETFTKYEIIVEEPVAGKVPAKTAKVIYSNDSTEVEYNVDILWFLTTFNDNGIVYTELSNTELIENDTRYLFDLTSESYSKITSDFSNKGYSKEDNIKNYINGIKLMDVIGADPRDIQDFYVGGMTEYHMYIEEPIVGQKVADTTIKIVIKTQTEIKEFVVAPDWDEINANGQFIMDTNDVFKAGNKYMMMGVPAERPFISGTIEELEKLASKVDHRTKNYLNDNEVDGSKGFIFGPLEEKVQITENFTNIVDSMSVTQIAKGSEYSTVLFADSGYKLPEMVYILIDGSELSSTSYSYDKTTGELIIPAEKVTGNITIVAEATLKTYIVNFDANGGKFSNGDSTLTFANWNNDEYNYDSIIKPTRDGYTFKGYYTEKTGGTTIQLLMAEVGIDEDMTFYAQWEENSGAVPPTTGGEGQPDNNDNNTGNTGTGSGSGNASAGNTNTNKPTEKNPQTGDDIVLFTVISVIAVAGIITTIEVKKYVK